MADFNYLLYVKVFLLFEVPPKNTEGTSDLARKLLNKVHS